MGSPPAFMSLTLAFTPGRVAVVEIHRPEVGNALSLVLLDELRRCFVYIDAGAEDIRAALLVGAGRHFCSGIDLAVLDSLSARAQQQPCGGRRGAELHRSIAHLQACLTSLEACRVPVVAAVHGCCLGGGLDLALCADVRYCSTDASFACLEVDAGLCADLGSLQRLGRVVGGGAAAELALTARRVDGAEAQRIGLVSSAAFATPGELRAAALACAEAMAARSPLAVQATKRVLLHARDATVSDGLEYVARVNAALLVSDDLREALDARAAKRAPVFARL